jgi:hypothetical protein
MRFSFKATMDDGTVIDVDSDHRDLRRWEAEYKRSMVGEPPSLTYMTQLAYVSMRRQRLVDSRYPTYELFDAECVDLEFKRTSADDDGMVVGDPTPSEATAVSSAT